jgi:hypothetical protein
MGRRSTWWTSEEVRAASALRCFGRRALFVSARGTGEIADPSLRARFRVFAVSPLDGKPLRIRTRFIRGDASAEDQEGHDQLDHQRLYRLVEPSTQIDALDEKR